MKVMDGSDGGIALRLLAAIAAGLVIGIVNYLLIRLLRIPPLIATLSSRFVIRSVGISYGRGLQIKPPPAFADLVLARIGGIFSVLAVLVLLLSILAGVVLTRTVYGRSVLAVGQNIRAARLAGSRSAECASSPTRCAARWAGSAVRCSLASQAAPNSMSGRSIF